LNLCLANTFLQLTRLSFRILHTGKIYGAAFAMGVPLRTLHGNLINCCASLGAIWQYAHARRHKRALAWMKTEHAYPGRDSVVPVARNLADVLVGSAYLSTDAVESLQNELRSDGFLAEVLLQRGMISDEKLCAAISLQTGVPFTRLDSKRVNKRVARTLPAHLERRYGILPFGVEGGRLFVAGSRVPPTRMYEELRRFTQLPVEFYLITRRNYEHLRALL
jgi:adsorption protein B